tara:strand:+ start:34 stop:546 length:513 start_codon:yes stop_codon:yes gene_type:complete
MLKILLFLLFFSLPLAAQEQWLIKVDEDDSTVWVERNGQVTHGDKLRYRFIKDGCDVIQEVFTFYTMVNNENIKSLKGRVLGLMINDQQVGAEVMFALPFLSGHSVWFNLGHYYVDDHIDYWKDSKFYEVKIVDNENFKAADFFDVRVNKWSMDNFVDSLKNGHKKCQKL